MTAVRKKKNLRGCGRIQGSYFKIQDPQRSVNLCTCWNVSYVQSLGNDSHQCRHLTKWTILQYHLTADLNISLALSFIRLHTTSKRLIFPCPCHEGTRWRWVDHTLVALLHGKEPPISIKEDAGYASVWIFWRREKSLAPTRIRTLDRSALNCRYTHYVILANSHPWAPHIIIFTLRSQTTNFCWV